MKNLFILFTLTASLMADIPKDKKAHALVGVAIYAGCELFSYATDYSIVSEENTNLTCLGIVVATGIGKEIYDSQHSGHTAEWQDAAYTASIPLVHFTIMEW